MLSDEERLMAMLEKIVNGASRIQGENTCGMSYAHVLGGTLAEARDLIAKLKPDSQAGKRVF